MAIKAPAKFDPLEEQSEHNERADAESPSGFRDPGTSPQEDIANLAYALWEQRGCPNGSPEVDWSAAEELFALRFR